MQPPWGLPGWPTSVYDSLVGVPVGGALAPRPARLVRVGACASEPAWAPCGDLTGAGVRHPDARSAGNEAEQARRPAQRWPGRPRMGVRPGRAAEPWRAPRGEENR